MYAKLESLMQWRMALLMSGRHQELAAQYIYPLPVYIAGRQQVMREPAEMETVLRRIQSIAEGTGVQRIDATVQAMELPRRGRFRVWVMHREFGVDGKQISKAQCVNYCRVTDSGIKIEMTEHPECRADWVGSEPARFTA